MWAPETFLHFKEDYLLPHLLNELKRFRIDGVGLSETLKFEW